MQDDKLRWEEVKRAVNVWDFQRQSDGDESSWKSDFKLLFGPRNHTVEVRRPRSARHIRRLVDLQNTRGLQNSNSAPKWIFGRPNLGMGLAHTIEHSEVVACTQYHITSKSKMEWGGSHFASHFGPKKLL
jgi:hypothetical protein